MRKKRHLVANVLISPVENQIEDREGYDLMFSSLDTTEWWNFGPRTGGPTHSSIWIRVE